MESQPAAYRLGVYFPRTRKRCSMTEKPTKASSRPRYWIESPKPTYPNCWASETDSQAAGRLKRPNKWKLPSF